LARSRNTFSRIAGPLWAARPAPSSAPYDKQAEECVGLEGAKVERVGEAIKITFDSGLMFDVNKYDLRAVSQEKPDQAGGHPHKYPTRTSLSRHTDSTGTREINMPCPRTGPRPWQFLATLTSSRPVRGPRLRPDQPIATILRRGRSRTVASTWPSCQREAEESAQDSVKGKPDPLSRTAGRLRRPRGATEPWSPRNGDEASGRPLGPTSTFHPR